MSDVAVPNGWRHEDNALWLKQLIIILIGQIATTKLQSLSLLTTKVV
jgi:hypothetical protein